MRLGLVVVGAALVACNSGGSNNVVGDGGPDGTPADSNDAMTDAAIDGLPDASGPTSGIGGPPLGACTDNNEWCWVMPRPQGNSITAVWASSPSDVWFSTGSQMFHSNGTTWTDVPSPSANVERFAGTAGNDIWAVTATSTLHWNGTSWSEATGAADGRHVLAQFGANDVWTVNHDTANHWDGTTWTPHVGPGFNPIAVGGDASNLIAVSTTGTIAKLIGTTWGIADATPHPGKSAVVIDPTHIVVIDDHAVMFWNNGTWTDPAPPVLTAPWVQVSARSLSDVWIAAAGARYHWNGTNWTLAAEPVSSFGYSLWQAPNGDAYMGDFDAQVKRWTGTSWTSLTDGPGRPGAVFGTSNTDIWAAGIRGYASVPFVQHWDGTTWSDVPFTGIGVVHSVNTIWGTASNDIWVGAGDYQGSDVEQRQMLHWDGTAWTQYKLGTEDAAAVSTGFRRILGFATNDIFAASTFKLYHWDGTSWTPVAVPLANMFTQITAVFGNSATDLYVAGGNVLFHWDGTSWANKTTPISIYGGVAGSATNIWLAGANSAASQGELVHYDGAFFVTVSAPLCASYRDDIIVRGTDFYTCGPSGVEKRPIAFGGSSTVVASARRLLNSWFSPDGHLYVPGMEIHAP